MFDAKLRKIIDPPLDRIGKAMAASGIRANAVTLLGGALALPICALLAHHCWRSALVLILLNRLFDGVDGAIARASGSSQWGGYLDSLCDYLFYIAVPLGFAFASPTNQIPALLLVASFVLTAVSFLALAAILAGRDLGHGAKAFTYTSGVMEGGETIAFYTAMCLFPCNFPALALVFAGLCLITVLQRLCLARATLQPRS